MLQHIRRSSRLTSSLVAVGLLLTSAWLSMGWLSRASVEGQENAETKSETQAEAQTDEAETRAKLEEAFAKTMSNATLAGRWQMVRGETIGKDREEKYTLGEVRKVDGDRWIINARIQYGERDFTFPVPVDVKWAGDTAVIQVTDWGIPALGIGPYSARVMIYRGLYSGAWFGKGDVGGLMSGRVVPGRAKKSAESGDQGAKK